MNHGITLITLAVTIIIMMILAISVTASMTTTIELKKYNQIKEDIILLTEEIRVYYLYTGKLPIDSSKVLTSSSSEVKNFTKDNNDKNPNDSGNYYPIDISLLEDINLNLGEGNKTKNYSTTDYYVVNETSLTVYYIAGAVLNGQRHYTILDDFSGGSFASEYYSNVNLPIISVVTMESNGKSKSLAGPGDTITLRILTNYSINPTVSINGVNTAVTQVKDKVYTATYTLPSVLSSEDLIGTAIPFSISNYSVNGKIGKEITEVTIGSSVYIYAKDR